MKRILPIAALLFATPALAQTAPTAPPGQTVVSGTVTFVAPGVDNAVNSFNAQIAALNKALNTLQSQTAAQQQQNTALAAQVSALTGQVSALTAGQQKASGDLTTATSGVAAQATALAAQVASLTQQVSALTAAIATIPAGGSTNNSTVTPAPAPAVVAFACPAPMPTTTLGTATVPLLAVGTGQAFPDPATAIGCTKPGTAAAPAPFVMQLSGALQAVFDIPPGYDGFVIDGGDPAKTSLDGQGGCPSKGCAVGTPHRLAWGKGVIHAQSFGTIRNLTIKGGGGADGVGDGEAGLYAENFDAAGVLNVVNVIFSNNEDGIFAPVAPNGANVSVAVNNALFTSDNGQSKDGLSHDVYFTGSGCYAETNTIHKGNEYGNDVKDRGGCLSIVGGYYAAAAGRWFDVPSGSGGASAKLSVVGATLVVPSSANANIIGYGEEDQSHGMSTPWTFSGNSIYIGRYNATIMVATGGAISFDSTNKWAWTKDGANTITPTIQVTNGGTASGIPEMQPAATDTFVTTPQVPAFTPIATP